jgi:hypothetical protein
VLDNNLQLYVNLSDHEQGTRFSSLQGIENRAFVHFYRLDGNPAPTELMEQAKANHSPIATGQSELS